MRKWPSFICIYNHSLWLALLPELYLLSDEWVAWSSHRSVNLILNSIKNSGNCHKIKIKCTINVMCISSWNLPLPPHPWSFRKIIFTRNRSLVPRRFWGLLIRIPPIFWLEIEVETLNTTNRIKEVNVSHLNPVLLFAIPWSMAPYELLCSSGFSGKNSGVEVAIPSQGSGPRNWTQVSHYRSRFFT